MPFATIDSGTTNSRVYILDEAHQVIAKGVKKVGVRDTAIHGSNRILKEGLKEVFEQTVADAGLTMGDITFAITSGMITSEIGLLEIPHLWAPVSVKDLAENLVPIRDDDVFPVKVPLIFIRGIKNRYPENATYRDIRKVDFMRGEEAQAVGLIAAYQDLTFPLTAMILSSHTKYISIDAERRIIGCLTTVSGQLYEAVRTGTSVGKSIVPPNGDKMEEYFDSEVIDSAYDSVINAGFVRTLLMPRFLEVLLKAPWYVRRLFIEAAIAAEDLKTRNDFPIVDFPHNTDFVLIGQKRRCRIFNYLLRKYCGITGDIREIFEEDQVDMLSIQGAIHIAELAGYLGGERCEL